MKHAILFQPKVSATNFSLWPLKFDLWPGRRWPPKATAGSRPSGRQRSAPVSAGWTAACPRTARSSPGRSGGQRRTQAAGRRRRRCSRCRRRSGRWAQPAGSPCTSWGAEGSAGWWLQRRCSRWCRGTCGRDPDRRRWWRWPGLEIMWVKVRHGTPDICQEVETNPAAWSWTWKLIFYSIYILLFLIIILLY